MTTTIHTILEEFREAARSKRDLGDKFERLIADYLTTERYLLPEERQCRD
jgi:hypothetical protein